MMMLFAQDIISRNPGTPVIFDVKCSKHLERIISKAGGEGHYVETGHSHIKAKIKQTKAAQRENSAGISALASAGTVLMMPYTRQLGCWSYSAKPTRRRCTVRPIPDDLQHA